MPGRLASQSGRKARNGAPDRAVFSSDREGSTESAGTAGASELRCELLEQWRLAAEDLPSRIIESEPLRSIDFGEILKAPRSARPFDRECVATDRGGVRIALEGPSLDQLAASLLDRCELNEGPARLDARLLPELARSRGERFLAGVVLALGNRPGAQVLVLPERTARMDEQHVQTVAAAAEHEQARAALRHVAILTANLLRRRLPEPCKVGSGFARLFQDRRRREGLCAGETCGAAATWRIASPSPRAVSAADSSWEESGSSWCWRSAGSSASTPSTSSSR